MKEAIIVCLFHWSVVLPQTYIVVRCLQCGSSLLLQVSLGYLFPRIIHVRLLASFEVLRPSQHLWSC